MTMFQFKQIKLGYWKIWPIVAYIFICLLALLRVHIRVETTLIGYQVGKLKASEIELIHKKSLLTMQLAKLTTKQNLLKKLGY